MSILKDDIKPIFVGKEIAVASVPKNGLVELPVDELIAESKIIKKDEANARKRKVVGNHQSS